MITRNKAREQSCCFLDSLNESLPEKYRTGVLPSSIGVRLVGAGSGSGQWLGTKNCDLDAPALLTRLAALAILDQLLFT
jgi:hypothetical protein